MHPPIPIDKSPLIMSGRLFVFWNQPRTGLSPSVSNDRVVRWSKAATTVNNEFKPDRSCQSPCYQVQTWQVLPEPMIIESRTWTRTLVRNTPKETCQVLVFIGYHQSQCYPVQTWQVLLEPTQPSSNLTGLTRAYATQLVCRDMKPVRQNFCGDLSGFNIYWLSQEPTQRYSLAGIWNQLGKTFAETCQVLIFFPSQISATNWFAFSRYLRLHALYESLRVWSIMNLFFNTLNLPVCGGDCFTSLAVTTCWRWFHELAMIGVS